MAEKMYFKLLSGRHVHGKATKPETGAIIQKMYLPGDIIECDFDLIERCGRGKFERVQAPARVEKSTSPDKRPAKPEGIDFATLSQNELMAFASDHKIDLKGERKTQEVRKLIEAHFSDGK